MENQPALNVPSEPPAAGKAKVLASDAAEAAAASLARAVASKDVSAVTGAVAAAITASLRGHATSPTTVHVRGGFDLIIHFTNTGGALGDIYLEGDARVVCAGDLHEEAWSY